MKSHIRGLSREVMDIIIFETGAKVTIGTR